MAVVWARGPTFVLDYNSAISDGKLIEMKGRVNLGLKSENVVI